jgi:hypothetical protein
MLKLTHPWILEIAISVLKYAILLFILLLILQTITWSRKNKKKVLPILTKLRIRTIIIVIVGISVLFTVLLVGILSVSARSEIKSIIENLKKCDALGVENSLMRLDGDVIENSLIQDSKKIQDLARVLSEVEYIKMPSRGKIATKEMVDIHIVSKNRVRPHSFCIIGDLLQIGDLSKFNRYESSDEYLLSSVRKSLGISDVVLEVIDPNDQTFAIPIREPKGVRYIFSVFLAVSMSIPNSFSKQF